MNITTEINEIKQIDRYIAIAVLHFFLFWNHTQFRLFILANKTHQNEKGNEMKCFVFEKILQHKRILTRQHMAMG